MVPLYFFADNEKHFRILDLCTVHLCAVSESNFH
jgi:hypothetical protein